MKIEDCIDTILTGNCLEILPHLPDKSIDVILTDPAWPGPTVGLQNKYDPVTDFRLMADQAARLTDRLIIVLGQQIDPRLLQYVPKTLPFVTVVWLRYMPPRYRGPILNSADLAYIFGHNRLPGNGQRVMPGEYYATHPHNYQTEAITISTGKRSGTGHPCNRPIAHAAMLIKNFTRPGETILDPFCGAGTFCLAARNLGRHYIGIEIDADHALRARRWIRDETLFMDEKETGLQGEQPGLL